MKRTSRMMFLSAKEETYARVSAYSKRGLDCVGEFVRFLVVSHSPARVLSHKRPAGARDHHHTQNSIRGRHG